MPATNDFIETVVVPSYTVQSVPAADSAANDPIDSTLCRSFLESSVVGRLFLCCSKYAVSSKVVSS